MQLDLLEHPAQRITSARAIMQRHLSQRSFWTHRGFRLAVEAALERTGITQVAVDAELGFYWGHISRACAGRSLESVFDVAEALGYGFTGPRDAGAVFRAKQEAA